MDVDRDTVVVLRRKVPEVIIPASRKGSAPSQPVEDSVQFGSGSGGKITTRPDPRS